MPAFHLKYLVVVMWREGGEGDLCVCVCVWFSSKPKQILVGKIVIILSKLGIERDSLGFGFAINLLFKTVCC